jgi:alkylhydroperoxidase/carboxymuconolactone decarboxylase family protein YurZ
MGVLTPHVRISLPYAQRVLLNEAAAGVGAYATFAINDVYDPYVTGAGAQPIGFDQYAQLYGRTRVVGFDYVISFGNITGTTSPAWAGVIYSPQSTLPANPEAWSIQPTGAQWVMLAAVSSGGSVKTLSGTVDIPSVMGVTKSEYLDEMDFAATTSGGPARRGYIHVWVMGYTASSAAHVLFTGKYLTEFSQPVALSLS